MAGHSVVDKAALQNLIDWKNGVVNESTERVDSMLADTGKAPKAVTMRMKMDEKFFSENFKPRLYCVLHPEHALLCGPYWKALHYSLAEHPAYVGDLSHPEIAEKINTALAMLQVEGQTEIVAMSNDGEKFDSTQHKFIEEFIDDSLVDAVFEQGIDVNGDPQGILQELREHTENMMKQHTAEVVVKNGRQKLMQWTCVGTVFSGETNTTV